MLLTGIILFTIIFSPFVSADLTTNINTYYIMNDSSGNLTESIRGYNTNVSSGVATYRQPLGTTYGVGVRYSGTQVFRVQHNIFKTATNSFSVCFTMNATSGGTGNNRILGTDTYSGGSYTGWFFTQALATGKVSFIVRNSTTSFNCEVTDSNGTGNINATHTFCGVRNSTHIALYRDGILNATATCSGTGSVQGDTLKLGCIDASCSDADKFRGVLAEVGFWNYTLSSSDVLDYHRNISSNITYPFSYTTPFVFWNFINQTPSDLTSTTFGTITTRYNTSQVLNISLPVYLNYTISNSTTYINNTAVATYRSKNSTNVSNIWTSILSDNEYFPAVYNYEEETQEATARTGYTTLSSNNDLMAISLINVRNDTQYNIFEVMLNTTSTGLAEIYYCNSSYTTGILSSSSNCVLISTFSGTGYNHTHNPVYNYSSHNGFSLPIVNGKVGLVSVSNTSWFIIKRTAGSVYVHYSNLTPPRTDTFKISANNGVSYSNSVNFYDAHLHQFSSNSFLQYAQCGTNITGSFNCSSFQSDNLDFSPIPPTAPIINSPTSQDYPYNNTILINYSASIPYINTSTISSYNISLLNSDLSFNKTINGSNTGTSQIFNPSNISIGSYYIKVEAKDSNNLTNYDISPVFNITSLLNIRLQNNYTNAYETQFFGWLVSNGYNQSFNSSTSNISTLNIYAGLNQIYIEQINYSITASNYYNFTLNDTPQTINKTFQLFSTNSIFIQVKDETTNNIIYENISIEVQFSNATIGTYYTINGTLFLENLSDGEYTFVIGGVSNNYTSRTYVVSVADRSSQYLTAFLSSSLSAVIFVIKDSYSATLLEDATISLYKVINNTLSLIEIRSSDITGRTQFNYIPLTKYTIVVQKTGYITKSFDLNPILFSSYDVKLDRNIVYTYTGSLEDVRITYTPTSYFANETINFAMIFSSATGVLENYGVNLSYPCGNKTFTGNNSIGETYNVSFTITCASYLSTINITYFYDSVGNPQRNYKAVYYIGGTYSASNYTWINLRNPQNHFGLGLLERILIVVLLALIVGGVSYLMVGGIGALILSLLVYGFFVSTGFIPLWSVIISIVAGVLMLIGGKE